MYGIQEITSRIESLIDYGCKGLDNEEAVNFEKDLLVIQKEIKQLQVDNAKGVLLQEFYIEGLEKSDEQIKQLHAELKEKDDTIKHLREKAEFNMPVEMYGCYYNVCTDSCDMIDGPCACGAWHSAKEWIEKLNKKLINNSIVSKRLQAELDNRNKALEKISRCNYYKPAVWIAEQALKDK